MFNKNPSQPTATGEFLDEDQKDRVAEMLYKRYYWEVGLPQWRDRNGQINRRILKQMNEVLDALALEGFKVIKDPALTGRENLTKISGKKS